MPLILSHSTISPKNLTIQSAACGLKSSLWLHGVAACATRASLFSTPVCTDLPPPSLAAPAWPVAHEAGTERSRPAEALPAGPVLPRRRGRTGANFAASDRAGC
jgi:hypothetical protein